MSSRNAWTGAIRPLRRAGSQAAAMVTRTPTAYAATTVLGARIRSWALMSRPTCAIRLRMAIARPMPRPTPRVAPRRPTTNASSMTDRTTWRREAPRARSSASSRLRCATRIEKVLTMM